MRRGEGLEKESLVPKPETAAQLEGPRADGSPHCEGGWVCSLLSGVGPASMCPALPRSLEDPSPS